MNLDHFIAAAGLVTLAGGMLVVNLVAAPRIAQAGTIVATFGLSLLSALAIRQLLS
jgi:hypothetical protein